MTVRACKCCGTPASVLLNARKGSENIEPTLVCHICDVIKLWPTTQRALRKR